VAEAFRSLWITEYLIFYDGRPIPTVSIMEFRDGMVARETQYFADRFEAPAWRAPWREPPYAVQQESDPRDGGPRLR
jgi:hypothetical protein